MQGHLEARRHDECEATVPWLRGCELYSSREKITALAYMDAIKADKDTAYALFESFKADHENTKSVAPMKRRYLATREGRVDTLESPALDTDAALIKTEMSFTPEEDAEIQEKVTAAAWGYLYARRYPIKSFLERHYGKTLPLW
jgi:hypothetical protein